MSLQLRKDCQSLLDGVGLQNYHVQIDPDSKMLQIVGACGQSFVSIEGIRLSRMAPNRQEIELALELFEAFLVKHTETFKGFIAAKAIADTQDIPKTVDDLKDVSVEKLSYKDSWELTFTAFADPNPFVTVQSTGMVTVPVIKTDVTSEDGTSGLLFGLTVKEVNAINDWVVACVEYEEATAEKTRMNDKLSSCEI